MLRRGPGWSRRPLDVVATASYLAGGLLLVWSAFVHFHLWRTAGYRAIPTIGPLFLVQSVAGLVAGVAAAAVRRLWVAFVGIALALGTLGAFALSVSHGLFGFADSWQAPFATEAFAVETAATCTLALAAALSATQSVSAARRTGRPRAPARSSNRRPARSSPHA